MSNWDKFLWWYFEGNFKWYVITWTAGLLMGKYL